MGLVTLTNGETVKTSVLSTEHKRLLEQVAEQLNGRELFPKSNQYAKDFLKGIKNKKNKL